MMPTVVRAVLLLSWVAVLVASKRHSSSLHLGALSFTLLGVSALAFVSFSIDQVRHALRDAVIPHRATTRVSAVFWEAASRNAWLTGVLGSVVVFVLGFSGSQAPPEQATIQMALAFVPTVYGTALAGACLVVALKLSDRAREGSPHAGPADVPRGPRPLALALFALLIVSAIWVPTGAARVPAHPPWRWLVHPPAVLLVLGAALGGRLFAGEPLGRRIGTALFAGAGLLGALVGVVQFLVGVASLRFGRVTSGLSFILSAAFVALFAMAALANTAEDRRVLSAQVPEHSAISRTAWLLFPLLTLFFLLVSYVIVVTPIRMDKG